MPSRTSPARSPAFHRALAAARCRACDGLGIDVYSGRSVEDGADPCPECAPRPTLVPTRWPAAEELCPRVERRYPAVPNTDDRSTWVPPEHPGHPVTCRRRCCAIEVAS